MILMIILNAPVNEMAEELHPLEMPVDVLKPTDNSVTTSRH